jgi:hypothetical protein
MKPTGQTIKNLLWGTRDLVALPGITPKIDQNQHPKAAEICPEISEIREPIGKIFFADGITLAAMELVR